MIALLKKLLVVAAIALVVPAAAQAQDFTAVVVAVKGELQAKGVNLQGSCGAFAITNEVATRVGMKLLHKGGGNRAVPLPDGSCLSGDQTSSEGYATDYLILLPSGVGVDILGDGGGANIPQWSTEDAADMVARNLQNWRNPVASTLPPTPTPAPVPGPVVVTPPASNPTLAEILQRAVTIEQVVADIRQQNLLHETAEAAERAKAETFRNAVGVEYGKFFGFIGKYIAPALATAIATWKLKG